MDATLFQLRNAVVASSAAYIQIEALESLNSTSSLQAEPVETVACIAGRWVTLEGSLSDPAGHLSHRERSLA